MLIGDEDFTLNLSNLIDEVQIGIGVVITDRGERYVGYRVCDNKLVVGLIMNTSLNDLYLLRKSRKPVSTAFNVIKHNEL